MVTGLLEHVVLWLNAFPSENAEIKNTSPSTLVTGTPQPDFNKRRVPFGSYVMAYKGSKNDMSARAIPVIALRESNEFGGFYFHSLETGNKFHSKKWDRLPISSQIIDKVHQLSNDDNQPVMNNNLLVFEITPGVLLQFDAKDEIDVVLEDENALLSEGDEGHAEMMADLVLENNPALISEGSDNVSMENEAGDATDSTNQNEQIVIDDRHELLSNNDEVEEQ